MNKVDKKIVLAIVLCATFAAYLRMFFAGLTLRGWHDLLHLPFKHWIGALIQSPLLELYYFFLAYAVAASSLWFTITYTNFKKHLLGFLLLGLFHGLGGYLLMAWATHSLQWPDEVVKLACIYGATGMLCGFYYYCTGTVNRSKQNNDSMYREEGS